MYIERTGKFWFLSPRIQTFAAGCFQARQTISKEPWHRHFFFSFPSIVSLHYSIVCCVHLGLEGHLLGSLYLLTWRFHIKYCTVHPCHQTFTDTIHVLIPGPIFLSTATEDYGSLKMKAFFYPPSHCSFSPAGNIKAEIIISALRFFSSKSSDKHN